MGGLAALALLAESLPLASDDAATVGEQVLTTDMHHETPCNQETQTLVVERNKPLKTISLTTP